MEELVRIAPVLFYNLYVERTWAAMKILFTL